MLSNLGTFEKEIIFKINEIDNRIGMLNCLNNILDNKIPPELYISLKSENDCTIEIKQSYLESFPQNAFQLELSILLDDVTKKLYTVTKLLHYLERNNYVILAEQLDIEIMGQKCEESVYLSYPSAWQDK